MKQLYCLGAFLQQVHPEAVELMLRYMYGEFLIMPLHLLIPCCTAADRFGVLPLITAVQEQLIPISFTPEAAAALAAGVLAAPIPSLQQIVLGKAALLLVEDQDGREHHSQQPQPQWQQIQQQQQQPGRQWPMPSSHSNQQDHCHRQPEQQWQLSSQSLVQHWGVDQVLAVVHKVLDLGSCEPREFALAALSCCCQWAIATAAAAASTSSSEAAAAAAAAATTTTTSTTASKARQGPHADNHQHQQQQLKHEQEATESQPEQQSEAAGLHDHDHHQQQQLKLELKHEQEATESQLEQLHAILQQLLDNILIARLEAMIGPSETGALVDAGCTSHQQSGVLPGWLGREIRALGYCWGGQDEEQEEELCRLA
jgi:hypothetical protein